jgi:hypothetical protein
MVRVHTNHVSLQEERVPEGPVRGVATSKTKPARVGGTREPARYQLFISPAAGGLDVLVTPDLKSPHSLRAYNSGHHRQNGR